MQTQSEQQQQLLWVEKYRPRKIEDITGNDEAKALFLEWLKNKKHTKKAVLLYGPPGVGKTTLVMAAAREFGFGVVEMNASDTRSEKAINAVAKPATSYTSLDSFAEGAKGGGNVLFLDEVDGIAGNEDRGGVNAILKIVEESLVPVIMAANDPDIEKLRPLKKVCLLVRFQQVRIPLIIALLQKICQLEHVKAEFEALERIVQNSRGDVRSAINDLQSLSEENHALTLQDTMLLSSRNKDVSMDETLRRYFSAQSIAETSSLLLYSSVDYDDLLLSVADNLPKRYTDANELAKAFNYVSQADLFRGRIGAENWHLLKYFYNALSEASAVNPESYKPFTFITPPIRIMTLFWTKPKRSLLQGICTKIGALCHVSIELAREAYVPYIRLMLIKKPRSPLVAYFEFTPEEVDYLTKMGRY
jgi:replication factor C large subunit